MDADANRRQDRDASETGPPTAFVETTPADRAGWEEALAGEGPGASGAVPDPGRAADPPATAPEYEEDHPPGPPAGEDDLTIADLRPEVEGLTPAERTRRGVPE